ncbi:PLD nuclease N-terminal domain-containing protein [Microbacterium halotolerans]|uniref:PLD nuclease N-terminal domain-containing protein n=1 Tax=Microbacterium halotolerans TaxID=246613 RepID=UPI000E6AC07E|nr:PLD nuclease N-terminal domain-containing protein [Microbacterium halotolerans]
MYVVLTAVAFVFFVITLVDVIRRPEPQVKFLPKIAWVFVVILIPLLGSVLWWAVGRDYSVAEPASSAFPTRVVDRTRPAPPPSRRRSTEQQLADLEREEKEERLRAEIDRRRREKGLEA